MVDYTDDWHRKSTIGTQAWLAINSMAVVHCSFTITSMSATVLIQGDNPDAHFLVVDYHDLIVLAVHNFEVQFATTNKFEMILNPRAGVSIKPRVERSGNQE